MTALDAESLATPSRYFSDGPLEASLAHTKELAFIINVRDVDRRYLQNASLDHWDAAR